jgi:hypothetical protein
MWRSCSEHCAETCNKRDERNVTGMMIATCTHLGTRAPIDGAENALKHLVIGGRQHLIHKFDGFRQASIALAENEQVDPG